MGCGPKAAADDAAEEAWLKEIARFANKSPVEVLNKLRGMSDEFNRLKVDEMRLTASERYTFECLKTGFRELLS